jgi:crotonobetainyl-CoA:carnitine CoA-transferase CaiB-like acyl-CoA transferase
VAPPLRLREHPAEVRGPAPKLGEGTRPYLLEAGYDEAEIEELLGLGIVAEPG